jgi:lysozyme family protein
VFFFYENLFFFKGFLSYLFETMKKNSEYKLRSLIRENIISMDKDFQNLMLEREFNQIFDGLYSLLKENGKWTSPNTYEWDLEIKKGTPDELPLTFQWDLSGASSKETFADELAKKIKSFVDKLPKEKVQEYFYKFLEKIKNLPKEIRRKIIISTAAVFLGVASLSTLVGSPQNKIDPVMAKEFVQVVQNQDQEQIQEPQTNKQKTKSQIQSTRRSSFNEAQKHVKIYEAGYSDDRKDKGNWIDVKGYGKRFVGTKYGISAPILAKYLGRLPKAEDMRNLSYDSALKIYKKDYWDKNNLAHFSNQSIANILYDGCVNQGSSGTKESLRNALINMGVDISSADDPFSVIWIKIANKQNQEELFKQIKKQRAIRYKSSDTFAVHGKGWLNRLGNIEYGEV